MVKVIMTMERLTPNEAAVVRAIRQWREVHDTLQCPDILPTEVNKNIAAFVAYLWRTDPYAVNAGSIGDNELRLFEVQLLYVISEQLAGNSNVTSEILDWWFALDQQSYARTCLNSICVSMKLAGVSVMSSGWVREYFQSITLHRVRVGPGYAFSHRDKGGNKPISAAIH